jgi:hypothetical protein
MSEKICNKFKIEIDDIITKLSELTPENVNNALIHNTIIYIDEMFIYAQTNGLIKDANMLMKIDSELFQELLNNLNDPSLNIENNDKFKMLNIFKQLLIDQLYVMHLIICKPKISDKDNIYTLIFSKKAELNNANRYAKQNNLFTDGVPFRKLIGGKQLLISKLVYKAYKNLHALICHYTEKKNIAAN